MNFVLKQLNAELDKLSRREQMLITLTIVTLISGLWHWGFYKPVSHWYKTSTKQVTLLNKEITDQIKAAKIFQRTGREASEYETLIKLKKIERKLAELEGRPVINKNKTLSPEEIPVALAQLTALNDHIRLRRLETLSNITTPDHAAEQDLSSYMFKQNVIMEFSGHQNDFLALLRTLESLPWSIQKLEYQKQLNHEVLTLHIFTLGFHKDWFDKKTQEPSITARK